MDYDQLREVLVNTENLYSLWQSTGMSEEEFIRANGSLIEETQKAKLSKERERARQRRFFEKQKAKGRRSLTCLVNAGTYDRLCALRDQSILAGEKKSLGDILDSIVSNEQPSPAIKAIAEQVVEDIEEHVRENPSIIETQTEIPAPRPDNPEKDPDTSDIIGIMQKARSDGLTWAFIADQLNEQGVPTAKGQTWTKANAQIFYSRNK